MALSGLFLVLFLLFHAYGNLKLFIGAEAYDHYAHWLKNDLLYPFMPHGQFIWIFRFGLLAAIGLHIWSAATLSRDTIKNRGDKYVNSKRVAQTYSARTMRWGGVILATGLVFHLLQFTAQVVTTGFQAGASPYAMLIGSFSQWWLVLAYAIWVAAVCLHVRHGVWSSLATLGANTSRASRGFLDALAWVIAIVLFVGFMIMPLAVLFGWIN